MPGFVRWRVVLDASGNVVNAAPRAQAAARVLAVPAGVDPRGQPFARLLDLPRRQAGYVAVDYAAGEYSAAYQRKLVSDMEASLAAGACVYLWEPGRRLALAVVGYPLEEAMAPWTDTYQWYHTATDALHRRRPVVME